MVEWEIRGMGWFIARHKRRIRLGCAGLGVVGFVAGVYTLLIVADARDSFGWTYLDTSEPRSQTQYTNLVSQYKRYDRFPWSTIEDVRSARTNIGEALILYHFEKLPRGFVEEIVNDAMSCPKTDMYLDEKLSLMVYKCNANGFQLGGNASERTVLEKLGKQNWWRKGVSNTSFDPPDVILKHP